MDFENLNYYFGTNEVSVCPLCFPIHKMETDPALKQISQKMYTKLKQEINECKVKLGTFYYGDERCTPEYWQRFAVTAILNHERFSEINEENKTLLTEKLLFQHFQLHVHYSFWDILKKVEDTPRKLKNLLEKYKRIVEFSPQTTDRTKLCGILADLVEISTEIKEVCLEARSPGFVISPETRSEESIAFFVDGAKTPSEQ